MIDNHDSPYTHPVISVIMFTISMFYKYFGEALKIYSYGADLFIKTGTGIIVAVTLYKMYTKWRASES